MWTSKKWSKENKIIIQNFSLKHYLKYSWATIFNFDEKEAYTQVDYILKIYQKKINIHPNVERGKGKRRNHKIRN